MKVLQHNLAGDHVQLDCTASAKEVTNAFNQAQIDFAGKMGLQAHDNITPAQAAEEQLGIKDLDAIVRDSAVEFLWPFAIEQRNLEPAYPPKPVSDDVLVRGKEYKFVLQFLLKPTFELSSYEPIELDKTQPPFDYSEVDATIERLHDQYIEYVVDDKKSGTVGPDDTISIKMATRLNGEDLPTLTFARRPYALGKNNMPEDFDKNIVGMKVGETKSFTYEAPIYDAKGDTVPTQLETEVTVLDFQKETKPEVDDAWVQRYMPGYATLDDFVDSLRKEQEIIQTIAFEDELRSRASEAISSRLEGTIPDEVFETLYATMLEHLKANLAQQNKSFEEYQQQMGGENAMRMMMLLELRNDLSNGYALDAVYRHFKLKISDDDINATCRTMNPSNPSVVRQQMEGSGRGFALRESARRYVAATYLVEHAIEIGANTRESQK